MFVIMDSLIFSETRQGNVQTDTTITDTTEGSGGGRS